jgi:hypothetical protein
MSRKFITYVFFFLVFAVFTFLGMVQSVYAVDDIGLFELEGNAVEDAPTPPEDWETLYDGGLNTGGNSFVFTGIKDDPAPKTIFDGGKKDIQNVSAWSGKDGSVPDKDDITNAYAAAYKCTATTPGCAEGDLIMYFGADRISNKGDAHLGFWFFKDQVKFDPVSGDFSGTHKEGDTLVLVSFPQASKAEPLLAVVLWDPTCLKADSNDPVPGECAAKNLFLIAKGTGVGGAVCDPDNIPGGNVCAITNTADDFPPLGTVTAPWPYESKNADPASPTDFPFETFYEGGINLGQLIGGESCFASFMAETRSSSSFTASLKDFVLDDFSVCAVELSKDCATGTYDPTTGNLEIPYSVTVRNTGSGTVQEVVATDNDCGFGPGTTLTFGPLGPNESATATGFCSVTEDFTPPILNGVSAIADGGETTVVLAETCVTDEQNPGVCFDACAFNVSPAIDVTKQCVTRLVAEDNVVKVKVLFDGSVTNTSNTSDPFEPVPLTNVTVMDDKAGGPLTLRDADGVPLPTPVRLNPGETAFFEDHYLPNSIDGECPSDAQFMDTVTASGVDIFEGTSVDDFATATCDLCPPGGCQDL